MGEHDSDLLEQVLRQCAQAAPEPWYPQAYIQATGIPREVLDRHLDRLRLAGLLRFTDWTQGRGQGYALTPDGARVLENPRLLRRLRHGELPVFGDLSAAAPVGVPALPTRSQAVLEALQGGNQASVTWILAMTNVLVFMLGLALAMLSGQPGGRWRPGSKYLTGENWPITHATGGLTGRDFFLHHEWWRLLSCCFVHIGVIHLAVNLLALYFFGPMLERMWGHARFLALYLIAGLAGSCGLLLANPTGGGAGASGALWGLGSAMAVWIFLHRRELPAALRSRWLNQLASIFFLNVLITLTIPGISRGAHFGGGLAGLVVAFPLDVLRFGRGGQRALALAGVAAVPLLCVALLRQAWHGPQGVAVREREAVREAVPWEQRYIPEIQSAASAARRQFYQQADPLLAVSPELRPPAQVKQFCRELARTRERMHAIRDEVERAGPFWSSTVRRVQQTSANYLNAWIHLLDETEHALANGREPDQQAGLEQRKAQLVEAEERWMANFAPK